MNTPTPVARSRRDAIASALAAIGFSVSLGVAGVAIPLLALRAGYSGTAIGVLTAVSALAQMATRVFMGLAMRRFPDWWFVLTAALLLAISSALAAVSAALIPFAIAHILQGVSRAFFWTGSQTHGVRVSTSSVRAVAMLNFCSTSGLIAGPLLAGLITESSPQLALAVGAGLAGAASIPAFLFERLPPFAVPPARPSGRIWRRPGVNAGCWASVPAGAWRGLLSSYVPIILEAARHSPATIGILVSFANVASLIGSAVVSRVPDRWIAHCYALGVLATSLGLAAAGAFAPLVIVAGIALFVSGLGAGGLQTLGPSIAADAVHPQERGDVIAAAGAFRAGALFVAPLAVAGLVAIIPLGAAMVITAAAVTGPVGCTRGLHRHLHPASGPRWVNEP